MPKLDTLHLEYVGCSYRCQMAVSRHLRSALGKAKLVRSLKTDSLSTANMPKLKVLHDFRKEIAEAERKLRGQGSDPLIAEALEWREEAAKEAALGDGGPDSPDFVSTALEHRHEELIKAEGPRAGISYGQSSDWQRDANFGATGRLADRAPCVLSRPSITAARSPSSPHG